MAERCTVTRSAAVLVLIDLQEKLAAVMPSRAGVVEAGALLAKVARELGIPIVATRQYPQGLGDVVPELLGLVPEGGPVDKVTFCCADEPTFCDRLMEPRVGWNRIPRSTAASISAEMRSPAPAGCT